MLKLVFHPDIGQEIKAAYDWYQEKATGLGDDFLAELESSYGAILELPETWPKIRKNFRRFILSKFPFSVIYKQTLNQVIVIAVMHQSRKPYYWVKRK